MASIAQVNKALKAQFPDLSIQVVGGAGYVYFDGDDGLDKIESIYSDPRSTSTENLTRFAVENINEHIRKEQERAE